MRGQLRDGLPEDRAGVLGGLEHTRNVCGLRGPQLGGVGFDFHQIDLTARDRAAVDVPPSTAPGAPELDERLQEGVVRAVVQLREGSEPFVVHPYPARFDVAYTGRVDAKRLGGSRRRHTGSLTQAPQLGAKTLLPGRRPAPRRHKHSLSAVTNQSTDQGS